MDRQGTELVFILDKSGSMSGLESDTIGGFNGLLLKQQAQPGACRITTALFDTTCQLLHDRIDIGAVTALTDRDYRPGGGTALLDAVGLVIDKIGSAQQHTAPRYRAQRVLVVIITDGMENASRMYSLDQVRGMIERRKREHGWEFLFLGANIDAVEVAGGLGIAPDRAQNYHADSPGLAVNFRAMSEAVRGYREKGCVDGDWSRSIRDDYQDRGGRR